MGEVAVNGGGGAGKPAPTYTVGQAVDQLGFGKFQVGNIIRENQE